jgi:hypothetical protein
MTLSDITEDELTLARLAALKLACRLHGLLSVGLASLQLMESPMQFFSGRDKPILAFIEVLRCTAARPGSETAAELAASVDQMSILSAEFYNCLVRLANWRTLEPGRIHEAGDALLSAYCRLLQTLHRFLQALSVPVDFSQKEHVGQELVSSVMKTLCEKSIAAARA